MSVRRPGLGRGLNAILGEERGVTATDLMQIRVDAIRPNAQQPRKAFDSAALAELEASVRQLGVIVPLIVRPLGDERYELVAGERRWRAAAAARLLTVPALVREVDDRTSLELAVVENLQRADLNPLEEAMGFASLIEEFGYTQEQMADRIGKSRPTISNALRLLALSDAIKARIQSGQLSAGHGRALLALPEERREDVAARAAADGLSVRAIESLAVPRLSRREARSKKALSADNADRREVENQLRYRLGAPVKVEDGEHGGRLEIRFRDESDLIRIIELLLPEGR